MGYLDGIWTCDDGGIYAVRQYGAQVWWAGVSDVYAFHRGTRFTNLFVGTLANTQIQGSWRDVPRGATTGGGTITLQVVDPNVLPNPVPPGQIAAPFEAKSLDKSDPRRALAKAQIPTENGVSPGGFGPGGAGGSTPQPLHMVALAKTGGFGGANWTRTGDPSVLINIATRMNSTRRNDDGSMADHLKMYKDWVVIRGVASGSPTTAAGFLHPSRQNYGAFICACDVWADCGFLNHGDPPDGDIDLDVQVNRPDLDTQPGFWTDGWWNDPNAIRAKLDDSAQLAPNFQPNPVGPDGVSTLNMFHTEAIMYGRTTDCDHSGDQSQTFFPGWAEDGGNRVLMNGQPCAVSAIGPIGDDTVPNQPVNLGSGSTIANGSHVRVTGFLAIDCHGVGGDCEEGDATKHNVELHPVYTIEKFQDFTAPRPAATNLSGVWHCSDVGTYYVRQAGQSVWWLGLSRDQGRTFTNAFVGTFDGMTLTGTTIDLPFGQAGNAATLTIKVGAGQGELATQLVSTGPAWEKYVWDKIYDTPPLFIRRPFPIPGPPIVVKA